MLVDHVIMAVVRLLTAPLVSVTRRHPREARGDFDWDLTSCQAGPLGFDWILVADLRICMAGENHEGFDCAVFPP